ncbi:MAG: hypothetical protein WAO19_08100 [Candidatus Kryptoniota bacterium]
MARISKSVVGNLSGTLGDIVFHQRNGKVFVRRRPPSFVPGNDPESVDRRLRFGFSVRLAKAICSIPELKAIWRKATPHGKSTFNFIVGTNTKLVNAGSVTDFTTIVPPWKKPSIAPGFILNCTAVSISFEAVTVELAPLRKSAGINIKKEPNAKLVYVLCLRNPVNKSYPDVCFISGASDSKPIALVEDPASGNSLLTFSIAISGQDASSVRNYANWNLLLALLTLDTANNPVKYSNTNQATYQPMAKGAQD